MHIRTNPILNKIFQPIILFCEWLGKHHPIALAKIRYFVRFKKCLNIDNPKTLNEKILYLSLKTDTSLWTRCADKYAVRSYVEELGLADILVPLVGVWDNVKDVDFNKLPSQFVLKTNHGCGDIVLVSDKTLLNKNDVLFHYVKGLKSKYGALESAHHYMRINPKLIAEALLYNDIEERKISSSMIDYKMWCFNGKLEYIMTCANRKVFKGHETVELKLYDKDWNSHSEYMHYDCEHVNGREIPKPKNFDVMIRVAEKLAAPFPCVRVDLYNLSGKIYFSELTFTSYGGMMNYYTKEFQELAGDMIDLSKVKVVR